MKPKWVWPPRETQSAEKWHFDTARIQNLSPYGDLDILTKCFVSHNWLSPLKIHPGLTIRSFSTSPLSMCPIIHMLYRGSLLIGLGGQIDVSVHTNVVMHYSGHYIYHTLKGSIERKSHLLRDSFPFLWQKNIKWLHSSIRYVLSFGTFCQVPNKCVDFK